MLAAAVSRPRWLLAQFGCAGLGALALLGLTGLGVGATYGLATGDLGGVGALVPAALAQGPAVLVLAGVVVVLFGALPRWSAAASWGALVLCLLMAQLGTLLELPRLVLDASPFTHVPAAPVDEITAPPLLALLAVAAALTLAGTAAFRRRDLAP